MLLPLLLTGRTLRGYHPKPPPSLHAIYEDLLWSSSYRCPATNVARQSSLPLGIWKQLRTVFRKVGSISRKSCSSELKTRFKIEPSERSTDLSPSPLWRNIDERHRRALLYSDALPLYLSLIQTATHYSAHVWTTWYRPANEGGTKGHRTGHELAEVPKPSPLHPCQRTSAGV